MKAAWQIVLFFALLSCLGCGKTTGRHSTEALQNAQIEYDSGVVCLQNDSLMEALPHFFAVANCLERLPEDMTEDEMLLTSKAYFQMANVFKPKMET